MPPRLLGAGARWRRGWLPGLLLLTLLAALPAAVARTDSQYKIGAENFKNADTERRVVDWAVAAEQELQRFGAPPPPTVAVVFVPGSATAFMLPHFITVGLPAPDDAEACRAAIVRGLLCRRLAQMPGRTPIAADAVPAWVVAAVCYRWRQHGAGGLLPNTFYPASHVLVETGHDPRLDDWVEHPMAPTEQALYQLYGEYCAASLKLLVNADRKFLATYLADFDPSQPAARALHRVWPKAPGREASDWFTDDYRWLASWVLLPGNYETSKAQLERLQTVSVLVPAAGGREAMQDLKLADLTSATLARYYTNDALTVLIASIARTSQQSPALVRPGIEQYGQALTELRNGHDEQFRPLLRDAEKKYAAAYAQGLRIRDFMDTQEVGLHGPILRLAPYFAHLEDGVPLTAYEAAVSAYLDRLATVGPEAAAEK